MASNISINCPQCGAELVNKPKTSFLSGHKEYNCDKCNYKGGLPLRTSTKIMYWTITVLVIFIFIEMASGGKGSIGLLGLIAPWLLYKDGQTRKKLTEYRIQNKLEQKNITPEEKNGVVKGVIFSILIVVVTFGLGFLLYNDQGSTSTSTTSLTNTTSNAWQSFHSTEGKFSINFPSYPTNSSSTETVNNMKIPMTQYDSKSSDGEEYMAQFVVYPVSPSDLNAKGALEGAVNGSVNSDTNNKLIESSFTQFGAYPAIDYVIYNSKEGVYIKGRNILVSTTLYSVLVASKNQNPTNYAQFLNSFTLTGTN